MTATQSTSMFDESTGTHLRDRERLLGAYSITEPSNPPRLIRAAPILVPFKGDRGAEGPFTLGQRGIQQYLTFEHDAIFGVVIQTLAVPETTQISDLTAALASLIARHEGLRTTHVLGEQPTQRVAASGTLLVSNYHLANDHQTTVDRATLGAALVQSMREEHAAVEAPALRVAVVTHKHTQTVRVMAIACNHFVVDLYGMHVVKRELAELLAAPAESASRLRPHQPLDRANAENTPAAQRRQAATYAYLSRQLSSMPQCLYPAPQREGVGESLIAALHSVPAMAASRQIAARTGVSRSAIVFAAVCKVLSERITLPVLTFPILTSNRFERALFDYVGTLTQNSLATVDVSDVSFDELVQRTWMGMALAGRYGFYDVYKLEEIANDIASKRGICIDWGPLFNNMLVEGTAATHPTTLSPLGVLRSNNERRSEIHWRAMPPTPPLVRFDLLPIDMDGQCSDRGWALSLWTGNTRYLPRADMEMLLSAVERLLIAAATGDLTHAQMRSHMALAPITRGSGWLLVDSCWIERREVQRLLDAALPSTRTLLVSEAGELVAYVEATPDVCTPEQAHARCVAALAGRKTALTPQRYVIWKQAPSYLPAISGWQGCLASGTGREQSEVTQCI